MLFSLLALLVGPLIQNARIGALRERVMLPAQEARGHINDLRLAFASAEASIRGFLLTGEARFLDQFREAREEERQAFARLRPLARDLDADLAARVEAVAALADRAAVARVELLEVARTGPLPEALLVEEEERHEELLETSGAVKDSIVAMIADARARVRRLESAGTILRALLALLALGSAILVMSAGLGFRRRAVEEAELRSAALALSEATEVGEVLRRIAALAARTDRGESCYVERIDRERGEVEIVAIAGDGPPPVGTRIPYPGSLTERAIEGGEPEVVVTIALEERPISRLLRHSCGRCTALVVPLIADDDALGALVILRDEGRSFSDGEILQRRTLGVLAALAIRKTALLEREQEQHEELKRLVKSRERLIRGFGHDVKNPLGAASAYAQLMIDGIQGELTEQQRRSLRRVHASVGAALGLIEDLIELARAEAGELEVRRQEVDIEELGRQLADEYRGVAESSDLTLDVHLTGELPTVRSDPQRIAQILGNLLSNAIKYTPSGGAVSIFGARQAGRRSDDPARWVTISVSDTGPGIPEEQRDGMFKEFRRLDPGASDGAGLGLAISQSVARILGGEITLETEVGEGSTFTLWLPV